MTGVGSVGDDYAIKFAENLLALLDEGRTTTTYKYLVLLAMLDCVIEYAGPDGLPPTTLTTSQLAKRATEILWPQSAVFAPQLEGRVLKQTQSGQQAELISEAVRLRERLQLGPYGTFRQAMSDVPDQANRLIRETEWKLIEMPLPRLQRFGQRDRHFIYEISWDESLTQREFKSIDFDNRIRFVPGAAECLLRLSSLLRPLIQRRWASMVARLNSDFVRDSELEQFMFGPQRASLTKLQEPLRDMQGGRCYYCSDRVTAASNPQVDHFIPWSRYPNDEIGNLVLTDGSCNSSKSDLLASEDHLERWVERLAGGGELASELESLATALDWECDWPKSLSIARGIYLRLGDGAQLWAGRRGREREFVDADADRLVQILKVPEVTPEPR